MGRQCRSVHCARGHASFHVVRPAQFDTSGAQWKYVRPYDTEKFYYFPSILAYPDEEVGVGITTGVPSASLGQMVMIGCDSPRTRRYPIKRSGVCPSIFLAEAMDFASNTQAPSLVEISSATTHVASSNYNGIPVLDDSQMSLRRGPRGHR